ncbi:MAG TPA: HDOD domain-containing protein [Bryobacteraceae bacterium]|nr:HDOD domain-containing protein [Bryobacteraceae bacterium]
MPLQLEQGPLTKDIVLAHIPAFPPVVLRVIDLLADEEAETALLVQELSADATLCAQILRLANSPLFGLTAQVDTVHHAVVTLGFARVQSLVTAVATTNYMKGAMRTQALHQCWRHTVASAVLCRELARAAGLPSDRAYSFGLLHDIGRLGLLVAYPEEYESLLRVADRDAVSLLDLEKKRFGLDHCEAGRQLVEQWKLPADFCVIAGRHHDPPSGAPLDFLTLAHAACQLADAFGYAVMTPLKPVSFDEICALLPAAVQAEFAENPEALAEILEQSIDPEHSLSHVPLVERIASLPERPVALAGLVQGSMGEEKTEDLPLFTAVSQRPATWELPLLVVMTLLVLLGLAAACYLSN